MRKPKKLINRKYLKEIGINENHWPETLYTSDHSFIRDHREKEYLKHHKKVGVNPAETWNLCTTSMMWLYERLIEYRNYASGIVDLEMHRFKIDGKEFTQKEILDLLIKMAEKYGVTVAQLCIRFIVQKGAVPVPKSATPERIKNNADVFGFSISPEDMEKIATLREYGMIGNPPSVPRTHQVVGF